MPLYERNRFPAVVKSVQTGSAVTRVLTQVGEFEIESVMTNQEAQKLGLRPGDSVMVAVKTTEVMLQRVSKPAASGIWSDATRKRPASPQLEQLAHAG
jgi:molybdopterin-binding protein